MSPTFLIKNLRKNCDISIGISIRRTSVSVLFVLISYAYLAVYYVAGVFYLLMRAFVSMLMLMSSENQS